MKEYIVIPQAKKNILVRVDGNSLTEMLSLHIPYSFLCKVSANKLIACLGINNNSLHIYDFKGKLLKRIKTQNYKVIAIKENTLYLAGAYAGCGEIASYINLGDDNFIINKLNIPIPMINGKAIDDIMIFDNEMIMVDNYIFPKYLLKYNIAAPNNPKHMATITLDNNGAYENIIKGDYNRDWIILFSNSAGMMGSADHITIMGKKSGTLSKYFSLFAPPTSGENEERIKDICLINDSLFVLSSKCLKMINLDSELISENLIRVVSFDDCYDKLLKLKSGQVIAVAKDKYSLLNLPSLRLELGDT